MAIHDSTNTSAPPPDVKPGAKADGEESIQLRVKGQDGGNEITFRVKAATDLKKLMDAYCEQLGTTRDSVRFLIDGQRINDGDTPKLLGMEDDDQIDALLPQTGGC